MKSHEEITEFFIGLIAKLAAEGKLTKSECIAFTHYADEYYTFYADDAEGRDIE